MIRNITITIVGVLCLFTTISKAQPGTASQFPYFQNFDTLVPLTSIEGQAGWYQDYIPLGNPIPIEISDQRGINGSQSMTMHLDDNFVTDSVISPLIGPITTNTIFGYSYKIVNVANQQYTLTGNAGFKIQIKQNIALNWNLLDSISVGNHVDTAGFRRVEIPIGAYDGANVNFRIAFYQGNSGEDFYIDIDSLVVYDPTITKLNTTDVVKNNYVIKINENNQISILNSNLNALNNTVNIFDVNGKIVTSTKITNNNNIDASQWNKGIYFVQINEANNNYNQKIIVR
jgi:hypothetical protein